MNLRRWGAFGLLFGAATFVGCDEMALDEVQDEQEDVIEAKQDVRDEEAELLDTQQDEQLDGTTDPSLTDPNLTPPTVPPTGFEPLPETDEPVDPTLPEAPVDETGDFPTPPDVPNEGDPNAGVDESADPSGESGLDDQETAPEEPEPALPQ